MGLRPWCCAPARVLLGSDCSETLPTPEEAEKVRSALEQARLDIGSPYSSARHAGDGLTPAQAVAIGRDHEGDPLDAGP